MTISNSTNPGYETAYVFTNAQFIQAFNHSIRPLGHLVFNMNICFELNPPKTPIKPASQQLFCTFVGKLFNPTR